MIVKQANKEDSSRLGPIFNDYLIFYGTGSDPTRAEQYIYQRLRNNDSVIFYVEGRDQQILGFTQLYPSFSSVSMDSIWILNDLFVGKEFRDRGIGSLLLDKAREFATEKGAIRLSLETGRDNFGAQKLYESKGYVKEEKYFHYDLKL